MAFHRISLNGAEGRCGMIKYKSGSNNDYKIKDSSRLFYGDLKSKSGNMITAT